MVTEEPPFSALTDEESGQAQRAQGVSLMLPWKGIAERLAEHAGMSLGEIEDASDDVLIPILQELGISRAELVHDIPELRLLEPSQRETLLDAIGFERWTVENIRRGAREEMPLPFGLAAGGVTTDRRDPEWPTVWAVATPVSDPKALAGAFLAECRKQFGRHASRDVSQHATKGKAHRFTPEEMVAMKDRGMSYKEIAIQSLRDEHPGIIENPDAYRREWKTERERVIKVIRAARRVWKDRLPSDSTG